MSFTEDGYEIVSKGVTDEALRLLDSHSHEHADANGSASPWSEYLGHFTELNDIEVFTNDTKQIVERCAGRNWSVLSSSIPYPQLTYSFHTKQTDLALRQHTDGAANGEKEEAAMYEIMAGVLLTAVSAQADGAFLIWPASHLAGQSHLKETPDQPAWNAIRAITNAKTESMPFVGGPGDVVVTHRLLQHATAPRMTTGVRRMAFFRLGFKSYPKGTLVRQTGFTS